nr:hypothetical protein [Micromonospora purpureochromogenes]
MDLPVLPVHQRKIVDVPAVIAFVRRHQRWVTRLGSGLIVATGLALLTGAWSDLTIWLRAMVGPGQIGV